MTKSERQSENLRKGTSLISLPVKGELLISPPDKGGVGGFVLTLATKENIRSLANNLFSFAYTLTVISLTAPLYVHAQGLENPLKFNGIADFVEAVLRAVVTIALPLIAMAIVYAGFQYVIAGGDKSKIDSAHKIFRNTIIGAILILASWALASIIGSTINELRR